MTDGATTEGGFDAGTYGRSFADVYDSWYPMDADTERATARLVHLCGPDRAVLEVGVGTGRLALRLAALGHRVVGMDSSAEMLARLSQKAAGESLSVQPVLADASDPDAWPTGDFGLVIAAYNFVFNLIGDDPKTRFLQNVRRALAPDGVLVVETFVPTDTTSPEGPTTPERHVALREITFDSVVLIASETNHDTGVVMGQHIELRDGEPVRLRPWRVHVATPQHLDQLATEAGLALVERHGDWDGSPFAPDSYRAVSIYRRTS